MDRNLHFNPGAVTDLGYSRYVEGGTVAEAVEEATGVVADWEDVR